MRNEPSRCRKRAAGHVTRTNQSTSPFPSQHWKLSQDWGTAALFYLAGAIYTVQIAVFFNDMLCTLSANSYTFYLYYVKIARFSAIYSYLLHLSVVVHYKTVRNNNVLSVNYKALPVPTLTLPDTFIFNIVIISFILLNINDFLIQYEIWKVRQKSGSNSGRSCQKACALSSTSLKMMLSQLFY